MDVSVNGILRGVRSMLLGRSPEGDSGLDVKRRGRDPASYRGARRNAMRAHGKLADWRSGPWHAIPRGEREETVPVFQFDPRTGRRVRTAMMQTVTIKLHQVIHGSLAAMPKAFA